MAQQAGISPADNSRVLQGVIAGVGFLSADTLLKGDAESQVKGLTTAAGIWLTAAIGAATGLGREATALLSTLLVLWAMPAVHAALAGQRKPGPAAPAQPGADGAKPTEIGAHAAAAWSYTATGRPCM